MLKKIAELHKLCFPERPWAESDFLDLKKSGCEIVASDTGFIVWRTVCDETEIITLGVAPDARKTGTATALLMMMESELKKSGIKKIFLEVSIGNDAAIALYKKNGYAEIAIRPKYYNGVDAIVMQKII